MFGKIFGYEKNTRTIPLLIVAKANNLNIELVTENPNLGLSNEYLEAFPKARIPAFEGIDGFKLTEANAISIFLASQNENTTLLGRTKKEYASIVQWMSFANTDLMSSLVGWVFPIIGRSRYVKKAMDDSQAEVERLCKYVNNFLEPRTFLVGECLTLADIVMAAHLILGFSHVFDKKWRLGFPNLIRWFVTVTHQPIWMAATSVPELIDTPTKRVLKQCVDEKPAPANVPNPSSIESDGSSAGKKTKHPLDSLPTGTLVLDEWKRQYSNNDSSVAMKWFWENFDPNAYSLWKVDYKYNKELGMIFQSSNLCGGFFQRLEASRKYIFGVLAVYGVNHDNVIQGAFIIRGKDYKSAFDVAPDWDSYNFTFLDSSDMNNRKHLELLWGCEHSIEIDGKTYPMVDRKVFK
ncbi:hypothetical protein PCANB_002445 [Pneumocystis canis]|nr:hypothetical protein PCANB_002445 [Pneumocystis canis]